MALTDFGKTVRKARLDAEETLSTMADNLGVSPAFLSAMETGRKNIPEDWVIKINSFFEERGVKVEKLGRQADLSNKNISLLGQDPRKQIFLAGFARSSFDSETLAKFAELLKLGEEK